ncbi:IS1 family transposase [Haemophilus influenzae]
MDQKYRIYIGYHAKTSEIMAFVWGKRDLQTALALKQRLKALKVSYERIAGDNWDAFVNAFSDTGDQWMGKQHTKAIEGNNCRIRHRLSRAVRRSCCFSKSMFYHVKSFNIGF